MRDIGDEVQSYVDKLNEALTKLGQKSLVFVYRDDGVGPTFSHVATTLDPVANLCAAVCLSSSVDDSISDKP